MDVPFAVENRAHLFVSIRQVARTTPARIQVSRNQASGNLSSESALR
jgi:hypothetical protein